MSLVREVDLREQRRSEDNPSSEAQDVVRVVPLPHDDQTAQKNKKREMKVFFSKEEAESVPAALQSSAANKNKNNTQENDNNTIPDLLLCGSAVTSCAYGLAWYGCAKEGWQDCCCCSPGMCTIKVYLQIEADTRESAYWRDWTQHTVPLQKKTDSTAHQHTTALTALPVAIICTRHAHTLLSPYLRTGTPTEGPERALGTGSHFTIS